MRRRGPEIRSQAKAVQGAAARVLDAWRGRGLAAGRNRGGALAGAMACPVSKPAGGRRRTGRTYM